MIEIGCSTLAFRKLDLNSALEKISLSGFKIVDIGMIERFCPHFDPLSNKNYKELAERVKSFGLQVATLNVGAGSFNDPSTRETQINFVKACLEAANFIGCYAVTVQSGKRVEKDWGKSAELSREGIKQVAAYGKNLGIEISVEIPHLGTLAETLEATFKFAQLLDDIENVNITLDTSHIVAAGEQPFVVVSQFKEKIGHVHLRDAKGKDILLTPGRGEVNFEKFLHELKKIGYKRACILELEYEGKTAEETMEEIKKAKNYIEKQCKLALNNT